MYVSQKIQEGPTVLTSDAPRVKICPPPPPSECAKHKSSRLAQCSYTEYNAHARCSVRAWRDDDSPPRVGINEPFGSRRVHGERSSVGIMATPDPVDPATLEIKTRSIEQTLLPLVKQVRQQHHQHFAPLHCFSSLLFLQPPAQPSLAPLE